MVIEHSVMTWQNGQVIYFLFLFFSFITKVECRKYHVTSHRVTKGVTAIIEWSCHCHVTMKSQVTVTEHDKEVT